MMDARITKAVSAGSINSSDQTALESALDSIDTSLSSSTGTDSSGGDMKSKIDSLIQDQVSSGTLTSDQASELQGFFAQGPGGQGDGGPPPGASDGSGDDISVASTDATQGTSGTQGVGPMHGHHHVHGGPPPASDDGDGSDTGDATVSDSLSALTGTSGTSSSSDGTSSTASKESATLDSLIQFLETLKSNVSSSTYGSASAPSSSTNAGLLISASA